MIQHLRFILNTLNLIQDAIIISNRILFHHHHHPLACCAAAASNPFRAWHTVPPLARGPWETRSNGTMQQQAAAYGAYGFNYSEEKQGETEAARV